MLLRAFLCARNVFAMEMTMGTLLKRNFTYFGLGQISRKDYRERFVYFWKIVNFLSVVYLCKLEFVVVELYRIVEYVGYKRVEIIK